MVRCSSSVDFCIHNSFFTFFRKKSHKFWEKNRKTGPQCNQLESKHEWSLYLVILVECTGSFRNANSPGQWLMSKGRIKRTLNQLLNFFESVFNIRAFWWFDNLFLCEKSGLDLGRHYYNIPVYSNLLTTITITTFRFLK